MIDLYIELNELNVKDFYGENNKNFKYIKEYFPKLKITGRDAILYAQGEAAELKKFEDKIKEIIEHYNNYNHLTERQLLQMLHSQDAKQTSHKDITIIHGAKGKPIVARTANQKKLVELIVKNDMVFAIGPAGTGKTYTGVALAVKALKDKEVKRIILTRPAVEAGENLGFLPGDLKEKLDPYLQPLYDALRDMISQEKLISYIEKGVVEIAPLAFMRGRTLDDAFVILDEAQNTTPSQMKMFLTRMGEKAKFLITGDPTQIDLPKNQHSGLKEAIKIVKNIKGISVVELDENDVVRHRLVKEILVAYQKVSH